MKINPQQKLRDKLFFNNICIIICVFCIVCYCTALSLQKSSKQHYEFSSLPNNAIVGPIKINDKSAVYKVTATFYGNNSAVYLSGEVLDADKDTIYEFGKDLWHESGYDSEGYWSESERQMVAYLTFSEKGTYYLQFNSDNNYNLNNLLIRLDLQKGSSVAHSQVGTIFMILIMIAGYFLNKKWGNEKVTIIMDKIRDELDD